MFKVDSNLQYINHLVSTEEIANAVRDDLANRESCKSPELVVVKDCKDESAGWDPGGVLMMNDKEFTFNLKNITIKIKQQHFSYFVDWVQHTNLREYSNVKYYKIHSGYFSCLCITESEFEQLKGQLNNPKLALEAMVSSQKKQEAVEGSIIQVAKAKDENGNDIIVKVKKKENILN